MQLYPPVEVLEGPRPIRTATWCRLCGRKHNKRESCGMIVVDRIAKGGDIVKRWTHPSNKNLK